MFKNLSKAVVIGSLFQSVLALPTSQSHGLKILKTSQLPNGQIIDWVPMESQVVGDIATPPPVPESRRGLDLKPLQTIAEHLLGPEGTVPILRTAVEYPAKVLPDMHHDESNAKPQAASVDAAATSSKGKHWYASSGQSVTNLGGGAVFSLFAPYVQSSSDFSLIQTAVIRDNAPNKQYGPSTQTVEAGWMNYPQQITGPHLFTFFNTNGYKQSGDNIGGYNRDQQGWVQTSKTVFPGQQFSPLSKDGGAQYDKHIEYKLYSGNWWLYVHDQYIGYYPASLFSQGVQAADTLASHSNRINFYGEVYNSETSVTTTDMGSGEFPETGARKSGYIKNIVYTDEAGRAQFYDGSQQIIQSDTGRYRIEEHFSNRDIKGSFCYLGGPGAGGIVGA
ncbi:Hypothetical protein R9X50_00159400 [Acrodontium crateriforme]|uniref:Neprosin PEP catalytic domain-containing protein n=1 Tax=Acrodontium crateriforme TaxID=150365 RepID=A0AAQ3R5Y4_9PEZI|nr:Hypothetical protein R9X50_00159400 [Acrodontium crateriforme]